MKRWIVPAFALLFLSRSASAQDPLPTYPVGSNPEHMVVGDFNDDGRPDLAVANRGSDTVSVLLGNGDGTFQAARDSAAGSSPSLVLTGDLNGDAKADLVTVSDHYGSHVLLGNGDGTFQPPEAVLLPPEQAPGRAADLGDLDGDGRLDLVATGMIAVTEYYYDNDAPYPSDPIPYDRLYGYLNVLPGNGDGTFGPAAAEYLGEQTIQRLALHDFDDDGRADVVSDGQVVRLGNGDGTVQAPSHAAGGALMNASTPAWDFDRDGKLDLLMQDGSPAAFVVRGNGDGTFQRTFAPLGDAYSAAVGDVNRDGTLDIVLVGGPTSGTARYAAVLLGYGDGTFDRSAIWDLGTGTFGYSWLTAAVLADLDGDGLTDLAVSDYYRGAVAVAHNAGNWPALSRIDAPANFTAVAGSERVSLSWSAVAGADGYVVQRGAAPGGPYQTIATGLTQATFADTSAPLGSTYYYVVAGVEGSTVGSPSAEAAAAPLPYPPTKLTAKARGRPRDQIDLRWTASAGNNVAYYKVYSSTSAGDVLVATLGTATSYTVTGLAQRTTYSFLVTAVHAGGQESFASNVASVRTRP